MKRLVGSRSVVLLLLAVWFGFAVSSQALADRAVAPLAHAGGPRLQAWSPPESVLPKGSHSYDPRYPVLVYDPATDVAHLAWEENGQVRYAWRAEQAWHTDPAVTWRGDSPALALDKQGLPHLVYVDISIENAQLQVFYTQLISGTWGLPRNVSSTMGPSTAPDLTMAIQDDIHVVWAERLDRSNSIYHAFSQDGGMMWSQVAPIPEAHGYAPALATGPDSTLWAVWQGLYQTETSATSDIWVARWDGAAWSAPENLSAALDGNARSPDLVVGPDGQLHVVWEQAWSQGGVSVCYIQGSPGQWVGPLTLSQGDATQPTLAFDLDGRVAVAWDAGLRLACRQERDDGTWSAISYFGDHAAGVRDVAIAASGPNALSAVWSARAVDGPGALWYANQWWPTMPTQTPTWTPTVPRTKSPTVAPTFTRTLTPTVTPSIARTQTATPTAHQTLPAEPTATPSPEPTMPELTATMTATMAPPTVSGPFHGYFPAMSKPITGPYYGETRKETAPIKPTSPHRATSMEDPWRWHTSHNLSSSSTASRDATSAWLTPDTALVVWAEAYPAFSLLYYSYFEHDAWSEPTPFFVGESPDLAVAADGTAHLVFSNEFGGVYDVFYSYWRGTAWTPSQNVSSTSGNSTQPALTIKEDGTPVVVWSDTTEGAHRIYYGWRSEGIWNTFLIRGSLEGSAPDIVVGKNQRVWVTWQALEPWGLYAVYAVWGDGITWQNYAIQISGNTQEDSVAPKLASAPLKGSYLVWQGGAQPETSVYYCDNLGDNYWWALPEEISGEAISAEQPSIVAQQGGQRYVTWDAGNEISMTSRYASASKWISPTAVISGTSFTGEPELALSETSQLLAIWTDRSDQGVQDLYARDGMLEAPYALWLPRASGSEEHLAGRSVER